MKIAVVCDVLGEENNGATIATMTLIRYLKSRGHTVRVVCGDQDKKGQEGYYITPNMSFGKALNKYVKKVGVAIAKVDEKVLHEALDGVDHIHVALPFFLGVKAVKWAKENNVSVTASFHMQAENFTSHLKLDGFKTLNKAVYKFIYNHFYKHVDGIHFPTEFIRQTFEKNVKKQTRAYVISNGVHSYVKKRESQKPDELKGKFVILTTGRYAREKAQDVLIKAVSCSKYKDKIKLILAGQGIKKKKYEKLCKKRGVYCAMKFFSRTEIIDVLNYSDMYVHPAKIELEGIACLEAIVCGKLTIVSDSARSATKGFAVSDKCVFKCGKEKDLARVIDYFIENPEQIKIHEQLYLNSAGAFNQDECMLKMEQMMFELRDEKQKLKA